jgi:uncharacterized protein YdeI (YjbR/CyaY-like superfamily)
LQPSPAPATGLAVKLFENAGGWKSWREENHHTEPTGLLLKIRKNSSGIPSVTYAEALDTAFCYGWIDGQRKSREEHHFLQRFHRTPQE